jgi:hypothetical protein
MKKPLGIQEHLEIAKLIRNCKQNITEIRSIYGHNIKVSSSTYKRMASATNALAKLSSDLENDYFADTTEAERNAHSPKPFPHFGEIYDAR